MRPRWCQNLACLICSNALFTNVLIWRTQSLYSSKGGSGFLGRIWRTAINCSLHSLITNSVNATSDDAIVSESLSFSQASLDSMSITTTLGPMPLIVPKSKRIVLSTVRPPIPKISTSHVWLRMKKLQIPTIKISWLAIAYEFAETSHNWMPKHKSAWFNWSGHHWSWAAMNESKTSKPLACSKISLNNT